MADKFQLKAIISAVDKLSPTLKGIKLNAMITRKAIKDIGTAGGQLMNKIGIPSALAFGAVVFGAARATNAAVDFASGIQDAADRSGAGTTNFQQLTNMLGQVGGTVEDAESSFTKFNKGIATAAAGGDKAFVGLLNKLKIPLKNSKGQLQSLNDILPELADGFAKNKDPATRTRMAMELFGKGGAKMIPVLIQGGAAIRAMRIEQERLGTVLSESDVGALDDIGDSMDRVSGQIKVQFSSAIAKMAPLLLGILKNMMEWIAANKELIKGKLVQFLTALTTNLAKVDWLAFMGGIQDTIGSILNFVDAIGGVKTLMIGLGIAWLAGPLSAIISIGSALLTLIPVIASFGGALLALIVANPVMLAIGIAIGLIARAVYEIYKNWGPIKAWFLELWESIKVIFNQGWELFKTIFSWSPLGLILRSWGPVLSFFTGLWDKVKGIVTSTPNIPGASSPTTGSSPGSGSGKQVYSAGSKPNILAAANSSNVNGEMTVRFVDAPQGMRVDSGKTDQSGFSLNPDVGYRTLGFSL